MSLVVLPSAVAAVVVVAAVVAIVVVVVVLVVAVVLPSVFSAVVVVVVGVVCVVIVVVVAFRLTAGVFGFVKSEVSLSGMETLSFLLPIGMVLSKVLTLGSFVTGVVAGMAVLIVTVTGVFVVGTLCVS